MAARPPGPKPLFWVIAGVVALLVAGGFVLGLAGFAPRLGAGGRFVLDLLIVVTAAVSVLLIVFVVFRLLVLAVRAVRRSRD
jgi:uncharacterized membrane protein